MNTEPAVGSTIFEDANEVLPDDFAFPFGIGDAGQGAEEALLLIESVQVPVEMAAEGLDNLLGLCFCEHCQAGARAHGIDAAALRRKAAADVSACLDADFDLPPDMAAAFWLADIAGGELAAYLAYRSEVVTSLVGEIRARVRKDATVAVIPSVARPTGGAWYEGTDLAALVGHRQQHHGHVIDLLALGLTETRALAEFLSQRRPAFLQFVVRQLLVQLRIERLGGRRHVAAVERADHALGGGGAARCHRRIGWLRLLRGL